MTFLLIIGTFEALFLILLLLGKKKKSLPDLFLGIIFLLYALNIGTTFIELYNSENGFPYPAVMNISWLFLFLHGPALWFYIKSFSSGRFIFKPHYLLHFIPFMLLTAIQYFSFIDLPVEEKIRLVETELFKEQVFYKISVICIGASTITYFLWALKMIKYHRDSLLNSFSKIDDIDLNWLRILVIASLICYSINVALFNLDLVFHFATYRFLMFLTFSFGSVYILVLGYFGLRQGNIFINSTVVSSESDKENHVNHNNKYSESEDSDFIKALLSVMDNRKPWIDPGLTVSRLGEIMNVKAEYLSEVLNKQLKQNFFDFINSYRTNEFKNQVISGNNSHLTIMGIAYNCGFNSKASFYRAFRKFEGISPTGYIDSVSQKSETPFR